MIEEVEGSTRMGAWKKLKIFKMLLLHVPSVFWIWGLRLFPILLFHVVLGGKGQQLLPHCCCPVGLVFMDCQTWCIIKEKLWSILPASLMSLELGGNIKAFSVWFYDSFNSSLENCAILLCLCPIYNVLLCKTWVLYSERETALVNWVKLHIKYRVKKFAL